MPFPANPTNGQTATVNSIIYSYSTATNSWTKVLGGPAFAGPQGPQGVAGPQGPIGPGGVSATTAIAYAIALG